MSEQGWRARVISSVAREYGAVADLAAVQEVQLAVSAKPDAIDVGFWRAVLGYAPLTDDSAVDPLGHGSTVWMQELVETKPLRHAMPSTFSWGGSMQSHGSRPSWRPAAASSTAPSQLRRSRVTGGRPRADRATRSGRSTGARLRPHHP